MYAPKTPENAVLTPSLLACHDLGDGVSDDRPGLLNVLLGQSHGHTHLERWLGLPLHFSYARSNDVWHRPEPAD
jgi:hypothetical protein